ncbi:MAG: tyrosine-type recombinase/integrase [Planctomycetaceae bacterium]
MPRPKNTIPSYLRHRQSGQARAKINGREFLLGQYGSEESRIRYAELVAKFASGVLVDPLAASSNRGMNRGTVQTDSDPGPSIAELIVAFLEFSKTHYVKNGEPTSEQHCIRASVKPLRELFGLTPAKDFGPLALKAVRAKMVESGLARNTINSNIGKLRRMFRFAVANEMIDVSVLQRLETVSPLLAGRSEARETTPRHALDQADIDAVKKHVRPLVRDLIDLQLLTGSRSGELLMLTTSMIDRTGAVWSAKLADHKCQHKGKSRTLHFGPKSQLVLSKYLSADPDKPLFAMTRCAYCRAITRGCEKAFEMPENLKTISKKLSASKQSEHRRLAAEWRAEHCWSPHWLRHSAGTRIREQLGIENVQSLLGHSTAEMSRHYSSQMDSLAASTAAACG